MITRSPSTFIRNPFPTPEDTMSYTERTRAEYLLAELRCLTRRAPGESVEVSIQRLENEYDHLPPEPTDGPEDSDQLRRVNDILEAFIEDEAAGPYSVVS